MKHLLFISALFVACLSVSGSAIADQINDRQGASRILQFDGTSELRVDPDNAVTNFDIVTDEVTAEKAGATNAERSRHVLDALQKIVGSHGVVRTGGYSIQPRYVNARGQSNQIQDWIAIGQVTVQTTDASLAGKLLDRARQLGVTSINSQKGGDTDQVTITAQVTARSMSAEDASQQYDDKTKALAREFQSMVGGKGTVAVMNTNLQSELEDSNGGYSQELVGYEATNSVVVETTQINMLGSLIDTGIRSGATRVGQIEFGLREVSKAQSDAVALACRDARTKAEAAAQALGLRILSVDKVVMAMGYNPQPVQMATLAASSLSQNVTTPIVPGQLTVRANVTVTFLFE